MAEMDIDETHKHWSSQRKAQKYLVLIGTGGLFLAKASSLKLFGGTDSAVNVALSKHM